MRRRDWAIWLLALLIALVLWFYVVSHQNLTRTLQVAVEVTGVPKGMVARAAPAAASVAVTGPRDVVERLTVDDVHVRAPLRSPDPGSQTVRLQVAVSRGLSARVTPGRVTVRLERRPAANDGAARATPKAVPIVLTARGQPAPGYRVDSIELAPAIATVTGDVGAVKSLRALPTAALELQDAREEVEARLPLAPPAGIAVLHPSSVHVVVHIRRGSPPMQPLPLEEPR